MQSIPVNTASRAYDVAVARTCLDSVGKSARNATQGHTAFIVSDSNVWPLWGEPVLKSLEAAGFSVYHYAFLAGEPSKHLGTLSEVLEAMAEVPLCRDDIVIALGGGVVGDVAGFAGATYMRGIQVIQVPTSLLAMVDSSVGGKTAVDLRGGKNLAGAFWQPSAVIASLECLSTIDANLLTDSCGEVIKHAVLADPSLFAELETKPVNARDAQGQLDYERLERIVARNIEIKRDVVTKDEKERGLRQTLNLGHTVGHAIESANNYQLGHGSSVAAGMCITARACAKKGICSDECAERIVACVAAHGLPTTSEIETEVLFEHALADKKRHGDTVNAILIKDIGSVYVEPMSLNDFKELIEMGR